MKKSILLLIIASLSFVCKSQELLLISDSTTSLLNVSTFDVETANVLVYLSDVTISWNPNRTSGDFRITAFLESSTGLTLGTFSLRRTVSHLDAIGLPPDNTKTFHDYVRDQIVNRIRSIKPFGLIEWTKQY